MIRKWVAAITVAFGFAGLIAGDSAASPGRHGPGFFGRHTHPTVNVGGAVAAPTTYSLAQLRALPQATLQLTRHAWRTTRTETDQGVAVEDLVNAAQPTLPATKNALLRVTVTVANLWGWRETLSLGELDPGFGNHPAYLELARDGHALAAPELVVPGDRIGARTVPFVDSITVAVQNPIPTTPTSAGALTVQDRGFTRFLNAARLASLPAQTLSVSFLAGTSSQQHTEIGPSLDTVLRAAHVPIGPNTWVAAVGSDGYVAVVTPAEAIFGGRPLQISLNEDGLPLAQPRLVVDGDVKGGRYVSDTVDLVIGDGRAPRIR